VTGYPTGVPAVSAALMLHLYPGVPVRVTMHPRENRAVVAIGTGTLLLDLFCDRAELVALRDALTAAVLDLDTARQATTSTDNISTDDTGGETAAADEVRAPAA
jgi:hypothetical protein